MAWIKWAFLACLVMWVVGVVAMMGPVPGLPAPFDMMVRPTPVHTVGGLTLALGLILLIRWVWLKLYP